MLKPLLNVYTNLEKIQISINGKSQYSHLIDLLSKLNQENINTGITYDILFEYLWLEKRNLSEIKQLPRDFYIRTRIEIFRNLKSGNENYKKLITVFRDLVQTRLRKILNAISISPEIVSSKEFTNKLTIEEEILVKEISNFVKDWINYVLGVYNDF